jgi:biopolymer transport protein ExbB/TolQ
MVRINCWAMPMLGFLGTVIGISDTLGQMDAQALASGSQDAMNNLTSGLYVAFDTTAVGLVLTMIAMFMQFVVQRAEDSLLNTIDQGTASYLHRCLSEQDHSDTSDVEASLKLIAHRLMDSMQLIVERQADLWKSKLDEAHSQWNALAENSQHIAIETITRALTDAMAVHRAAMQEDLNHLVLLQSEGAMQIDQRLQQWQTTISEQARVTLRQQQELNRNAELLEKLLESSQLVQAMQQPLQATLERLTDVDRFEEAAISLSEAVMVLTSQLQRSGQLGRQTVRRRTATTDPNAFSTEITEQENLQPTPGSSLETGASSTAASSRRVSGEHSSSSSVEAQLTPHASAGTNKLRGAGEERSKTLSALRALEAALSVCSSGTHALDRTCPSLTLIRICGFFLYCTYKLFMRSF